MTFHIPAYRPGQQPPFSPGRTPFAFYRTP